MVVKANKCIFINTIGTLQMWLIIVRVMANENFDHSISISIHFIILLCIYIFSRWCAHHDRQAKWTNKMTYNFNIVVRWNKFIISYLYVQPVHFSMLTVGLEMHFNEIPFRDLNHFFVIDGARVLCIGILLIGEVWCAPLQGAMPFNFPLHTHIIHNHSVLYIECKFIIIWYWNGFSFGLLLSSYLIAMTIWQRVCLFVCVYRYNWSWYIRQTVPIKCHINNTILDWFLYISPYD